MVIKLINNCLIGTLFILGIIFLFFSYRYETFYWMMFVSFVISIFLYFLIKKLNLGEKEYLIVLIIIWLNVLGELWFYFNFLYYDKVLHFTVPFGLAFLYSQYLKKNNQTKNLFFVFTVLGFLALFEIFEWTIDSFVGFPMLGVLDASGNFVMDKLTDTMADLITGIFGILSFLFFEQKFKKEKFK